MWFNTLKNYGEGIDALGNVIFVIGEAFPNPLKLVADKRIKAVLKKDQGRVYTFQGKLR